jgi:polysaccharide pyruvyl transferase WcaK-like protein
MRPSRIVFYGNFGAGNLGNEVTLQTAIEQTLARMPGAELLCVCTNPEDVRSRHGIAAAAAMSRDSGWSWRDLEVARAPVSASDAMAPGGLPARRGCTAQLRRFGRIAFNRLPRELAHWYRMLRLMARSDVFLVPGTGIITDGSCGSLGWPYDMFKLSLLARLSGKQVVYLSVGAGPFERRLGSWLIRRSLALAHYRSYRDADSKQRLEAIGFDTARDAVYPDLVFGLSGTHLKERDTTERQRVVGLGLKDYATPVGAADAQDYRDYLSAMADFVVWLQARGYQVRLIIGDAQYDTRVREELVSLLASRGAGVTAPQLRSDPVPTVDELLRQLGETDLVISPRFHNLVLALLLNKPVIALSDLPKVTALLGDLGFGRFCLSLEGLKTHELTGRFEQLQSEAESLRSEIASAVAKYRGSIDQQYAKVYSSIANHRGS